MKPESLQALQRCHPDIVLVLTDVDKDYGLTVTCGERNGEDQHKAFVNGFSKLDTPNGPHEPKKVRVMKHVAVLNEDGTQKDPVETKEVFEDMLLSLAVDVQLEEFSSKLPKEVQYKLCGFLAGVILERCKKLGVKPFRWGGNWDGGHLEAQSFEDLFHFEVRP